MPYQKLVTIYTREERRRLHAQGIWVDKDGNQLRVREMNGYRLSKLVRTLVNWAEKEVQPFEWLSSQPIFIHVLMRIRDVGLHNFCTEQFEFAYRNSVQENRIWQR